MSFCSHPCNKIGKRGRFLQSRKNLQTIKGQLVMGLRMVLVLLKIIAMKILISEEVTLTKALAAKL